MLGLQAVIVGKDLSSLLLRRHVANERGSAANVVFLGMPIMQFISLTRILQ